MPGGGAGVGVGFVNFGWGVVGAIVFEYDRDLRGGDQNGGGESERV
jgi:hypothetical protein